MIESSIRAGCIFITGMEVSMNANENTVERHGGEAEILHKALAGDIRAVNKVLMYLSSANPYLRQIMQETIHDLTSTHLWRHLLRSLALQRWDGLIDCERRSDVSASRRIDRSVTETFIKDESEYERSVKESLLLESLRDRDVQVSQSAAYLLGMRGDPRAIPALAEIIDQGTRAWKARAIRALGSIQDERSGPPLGRALAMDRSLLHREARRALFRLGPYAEPAYLMLLVHEDNHIRWHAARGLGELGYVHAIEHLADGLRDENSSVAWATARVLADLGAAAIPAILTQISRFPLHEVFRQTAYHALHNIRLHRGDERLKPLLDALRGPAASVEAPGIAQRLLIEDQARQAMVHGSL
jgi:HEAT repeat protein